MLSNYFTLRSIAGNLDVRLSRSVLIAAFSQSRNELILTFDNDLSLVVCCDPALNALYCRGTFSRARKNSVDVFRTVIGTKVSSVSLLPADREIHMVLGDGKSLVIQLFGSKANVFLIDEHRTIIESFLHPRELQGQTLDPPHPPLPDLSPDEFAKKFRGLEHGQVFAIVKKLHPLLGSVLVREVLHRAGIPEHRRGSELLHTEIGRIADTIEKLQSDLEQPSPRTYREHDTPVLFALIELRMFTQLATDEYENIHDAIAGFVRSFQARKGFLKDRSALESSLMQEIERTERTMEKMADERAATERATFYELAGTLLKAQLSSVQKGMNSVHIQNIFSPKREEVEIPLDPHLSGARNADAYFARAKKTRHSLQESEKRRALLVHRLNALQKISDALGRVHTDQGWREFLEENAPLLTETGIRVSMHGRPKSPPPPFRTFVVDGGFEVWAGKNSENNDILTLKHARPNDYWFHARGSGGSHVVLRRGSGKGEVSKRAIEQAASIAAYYSKMKSSRLVPVAVTLCKYVRKPRGAPAGTVAVEREDVLMVKPELPPGGTGESS